MKTGSDRCHPRPLLFLFALSALALAAGGALRHGIPLPQDRGTAGTLAALQRLPVFVRVLQIVAHPDDESAGSLVWLSRKAHARTAVFSFTRGDGGQNVLGNEKYEAMGLLRTGEYLAACEVYGAELYFGLEYDFGFSKTAEETFSKWGHEESLEELVRFIRTWRPTIVISRFQGTPADGHGHHQAAGILAREAFSASADADRFPQQLRQGLRPWQARKFYVSQSGGGRGSEADATWTVRVPTGDYDPVLGLSYREIGAQGYRNHRSQGNAAAFASPGPADEFFRLAKSTTELKEKETSFFDSIDTTLPAIADLAGKDQSSVLFLRNSLAEAQRAAEEAIDRFVPEHPERSAGAVARGTAILAEALLRLQSAAVPADTRVLLKETLEEKLADFQAALAGTLGVRLVAQADSPAGVPGGKVPINLTFYDRGPESLELGKVSLQWSDGTPVTSAGTATPNMLAAGQSARVGYEVGIPPDWPVTQPYWYLESPKAARYKARPTPNPFAPFGPPVLCARVSYRYGQAEGVLEEAVTSPVADPLRGLSFPDFQIVPAVSLSVDPGLSVVPLSSRAQSREFRVSVLNNDPRGVRGTVQFTVPGGWHAAPPESSFELSKAGEAYSTRVSVQAPPDNPKADYELQASAYCGGMRYEQGYRVVIAAGDWSRNLYSPSRARLEVFDLKITPGLTVGYVTGAGDDVPDALRQLGASVQMLNDDDLAFGGLGRYSAIVTGIRAFNVNTALRSHWQRLLDYVSRGGTLIVQYNTPLSRGPQSPFPYAPYPLSNSASERITDEDAPITILEPQNPVLTTPNKIGPSDFDGWIQERGLYFMTQWDPRYIALFSGHDAGERPARGGMLIARYGKGYYLYTAYAWFRELPAGVPGAFRIFANMLSLAPPRQ